MNSRNVLRWLGVAIAIPAGGFFGFISGYYMCLGILHLQNKGNSHNDVYTVVAAGGLGLVLGALFLPFCVWSSSRERRK